MESKELATSNGMNKPTQQAGLALRDSKGFTLIETIIYLALFSIIIGGGIVGAFGIIEGSDRASASAITQQEGLFVMRKLNWALTGATSASVPNAEHLVVIRDSVAIDFTLDGTTVEMDGIPLTSENVKISNLVFTKTVIVGKPDAIIARFVASGTKGASQSFETTKYLR